MATDTSVVLYDPPETSSEVKALAGFLAGYSGRTREAYTLDLRMFYRWCDEHRLELFSVPRTHIELYARELEELGRAPATIGRRLSTLLGFYRYAAEEGVIEHSPAVHIRRPRLDYESHAVGLDRNELGGFLVAAGLPSPRDHALCSLLGAQRTADRRSPRRRHRTARALIEALRRVKLLARDATPVRLQMSGDGLELRAVTQDSNAANAPG